MDISDFLQIEKKYDLYHQEVSGVQPWQYFRMNFWNYQICSQQLGLSDSIVRQKKWKQVSEAACGVMEAMFRNNRPKKADYIFFAHCRRVRNGRYFECIYTDELAQAYPGSMVFECPYGWKHLRPVKPGNIYYVDTIAWGGELCALFHSRVHSRKYREIYSEIEQIFQAPLEEIGRQYDIPLEAHKLYGQLTHIVLAIMVMKKKYARILNRVSPKLIVEVVYYSRHCMALNELAKEKGIPTVELQHGTMHSAHAAYQFHTECGEIQQFPDYVYVFSEYWKKCAHLPIPEEHVKVTGYPYFERQLNQYRRHSETEAKSNIIFVSQGTIGRELSRLAADLCDLLDQNQYHIIYKLHPGEYSEWKDRYPWLTRSNIEVIDNLQHNIYEYFARCTIQVGVYSTAIYEGLGFGLKTYIYNIGHADTMAELWEQGYAVCVNSAEELFGQISSIDGQNGQDGKMFWRKNSFENIRRELDQLLMSQRKEGMP